MIYFNPAFIPQVTCSPGTRYVCESQARGVGIPGWNDIKTPWILLSNSTLFAAYRSL